MNPTQDRVAGKTAIVTGGRGDLGSATAALLAEHGARVASLDVAGIPAASAHASISEYDVDVTSEDSVADAVRRVRDELGTPDILVNAAGIIGPAVVSTTGADGPASPG